MVYKSGEWFVFGHEGCRHLCHGGRARHEVALLLEHVFRGKKLDPVCGKGSGVKAMKMGLYRINLKIQALRSHHQHLLKHLSFLAGHLTQLEVKFQ